MRRREVQPVSEAAYRYLRLTGVQKHGETSCHYIVCSDAVPLFLSYEVFYMCQAICKVFGRELWPRVPPQVFYRT